MSSCSLDLSFYIQNVPNNTQELNLPMKLSAAFTCPEQSTLSLFIKLKLELSAAVEKAEAAAPQAQSHSIVRTGLDSQQMQHETNFNQHGDIDPNVRRMFSLSIDFYRVRSLIDSASNIYFK